MNPVAPTGPSRLQLAHEADFALGDLRVRPSLCEVKIGETGQRLEPRVMQVLVSLAQAQPAVLTRDDLIASCWGGVVVGDDAINRVIGKIRRLSAQSRGGFSVETVPRVGYRLALGSTGAGRPLGANGSALQPSLSRDDGRPLVALLPLDDGGDDADMAFALERVTTSLFEALKRSPWLSVVSRSSVMMDRLNVDARRIATDLAVQYLVYGQARFSADQFRISMKMVDGRDDDLVWSGSYQRAWGTEASEDDAIAHRVVNAVETALLGREEGRILQAASANRHWDLFLRARWHIWRATRRSNALGQELLAEALELKPDDVPTLSLLVFGKVCALWGGWADDPAASRAEAERLALKAVAIDPTDAFAHYANGTVLAAGDRLERAEAEQRRALELNPHFDLALGELGRLRVFSGDTEGGLAILDRAIATAPHSPNLALWTRDKAVAHFIDGRYSEAVDLATAACAKRPNWFLFHYFRAACLAAADRMDEAHEALAAGRALSTPYPMRDLWPAHPFVRAQDMARFLEALRRAGWDD